MSETKRLPEIVVCLKVNEANFINRMFKKNEIEE